MDILWIIITITIIVTALRRRIVLNSLKTLLPPSPPSFPIIGHLHLMNPPVHQALHKLSSKYGPILQLYLGSTPCIAASTADVARDLLKANDAALADRPQTVASRHFAYESSGFAFAPYGPYWRFMKRLCMSELLSVRTIERLQYVRREELMSILGRMKVAADRDECVDVSKCVLRMTNNEMMRMVASTTAKETEEVKELVKQVAEIMGTFNLADYIGVFRLVQLQGMNGRMRSVRDKFDALMERIIQAKIIMRRRRDGDDDETMKVDLVDMLLRVAEDEQAEIKLTRENIKAFMLDIFTAGSDSTAATIEWALTELINNSHTLHKLREEINCVVGKKRIPDESDLPNLPYLQAVIKETLRLHPAAAIVHRQCTKDIKVAGYDIPANTNILVNLWSIGRDAKYWQDPLEFLPERFLHGSTTTQEVDVRGQHFQVIPFGSGRRGCPGAALALQVVSITVAALVHCFKWKAEGILDDVEDGQKKRLDMEEGVGMVIAKAQPLKLVPVARLNPFPSLQT